MPKLSHTILYTKDEDLLYKFFKRYDNRDDVKRELNPTPDENGNMCCKIIYIKKS